MKNPGKFRESGREILSEDFFNRHTVGSADKKNLIARYKWRTEKKKRKKTGKRRKMEEKFETGF